MTYLYDKLIPMKEFFVSITHPKNKQKFNLLKYYHSCEKWKNAGKNR